MADDTQQAAPPDDEGIPTDSTLVSQYGQQLADAIKNKWNEGGARIHDALQRAKSGDMSGLQDMAVQNAMSTVGATELAGPDIFNQEIYHVRAPEGAPRDIYNQEQVPVQDAQEAVTRIAQKLQERRAARGYADGGDVQPEAAQASAQAPEENRVNVLDPDGQLVSLPAGMVPQALQAGFSPATQEHIDNYVKQQQYGSTGQQILTGLEGAANTVIPGAGYAAEQALGLSTPEAQSTRREVNPITYGVGQLGGLGASMLTGFGEAGLMAKAAEAAAAPIEGVGILAKVGSAAIKGAVDNALFQSGDEVSKMIAKDPGQTAETALLDTGLAGAIGGSLGAAGAGIVSPLWKATVGTKIGGILGAVADKAGGIEGLPTTVASAIEKSGIEVPPEVQASFYEDPAVRQMFQTLQDSATSSGLKAQTALKEFKQSVAEHLANTLGVDASTVTEKASQDAYEMGSKIKSNLQKTLQDSIDPIAQKFDAIKDRFQSVPLDQATKSSLAEKIGEMANTSGYALSPGSPQAKLVSRVLDDIGNLKTLDDIRKYGSIIGDQSSNPELWHVGSSLKRIFRGVEESALEAAVGDKAPALLGQLAEARGAYSKAMDTIDSLNDRLRVGKYSGPQSFYSALRDMTPEDMLRRLSPKGDAGIIGELSQKFPETADMLRQYHAAEAINSGFRAGEFNPKAFFTNLEKMSPQMQQFIAGQNGEKLDALKTLISSIPEKVGKSGTPQGLDALMSRVPGSAMGILTYLMGHGAGEGLLVGQLTKAISRDVPDAVRLSLLKFLGSTQKVDAGAFAKSVNLIRRTISGENLLSKSVKNIFRAGKLEAGSVLSESMMPSEKKRERLDKALQKVQDDHGNQVAQEAYAGGSYMPDHDGAATQMTANAITYLNKLRPTPAKKSPLDSTPVVNPAQRAAYNSALDIGEQPLLALHKVKEGSLTSQDLTHLQNMYPNLYARMRAKIGEQIASQKDASTLPYRTKQAISLFMGQPMDSTFLPQSIVAAQPMPAPSPQDQGGPPPGRNKRSTASLGKMNSMYKTPLQAAEEDKATEA